MSNGSFERTNTSDPVGAASAFESKRRYRANKLVSYPLKQVGHYGGIQIPREWNSISRPATVSLDRTISGSAVIWLFAFTRGIQIVKN